MVMVWPVVRFEPTLAKMIGSFVTLESVAMASRRMKKLSWQEWRAASLALMCECQNPGSVVAVKVIYIHMRRMIKAHSERYSTT